MISKKEIQRLLNDLESDRVERTISTDKMDKFGEAICSFSNDLPNVQEELKANGNEEADFNLSLETA